MLLNQILKDKLLKGPIIPHSKYAPSTAVIFQKFSINSDCLSVAMGTAAISVTSHG